MKRDAMKSIIIVLILCLVVTTAPGTGSRLAPALGHKALLLQPGKVQVLGVVGTWCGHCHVILERDAALRVRPDLVYRVLLSGDESEPAKVIADYLARFRIQAAWHISDERLRTMLRQNQVAVPARIILNKRMEVGFVEIGVPRDDAEFLAALQAIMAEP